MGQSCSSTDITSPTPPTVHIDTAPLPIHVHRATPQPVQFVISPEWSDKLQHATTLHPLHSSQQYPYLELQFQVIQGAIHHLELSVIKIDATVATKNVAALQNYKPPTMEQLCTTSIDHRVFTLRLTASNTCNWCAGAYKLLIHGNLQYISVVNASCKAYMSAASIEKPPEPLPLPSTTSPDVLEQLQALNDQLQQTISTQQQSMASLQDQLQECQQELAVKQREVEELEAHSGLTASAKQNLELRYQREIDAIHAQHHSKLQNSSSDGAVAIAELEAHNTELAKRTQDLVTSVNQQKRKRAELLIATWRFRCLQPVYQQWRQTAHSERQHKKQLLEKYVTRLAHAELYRMWRQWHGFSKVTAVQDVEQRYQKQLASMQNQLLAKEESELTLKQSLIVEKRKRAQKIIELLRGQSQQSCFHAWHKYTLEERQRKRSLVNRAMSHMINLPLYSAWRQWQSFTNSVNRQELRNSGKATATQQRCAALEVRLAEQDKLLAEARQASYAAKLDLTVNDKKCKQHRHVLNLLVPLFQQLRYNTFPAINEQLQPFCNVGCDCKQCINRAKSTFALVVQLMQQCESDADLRKTLESNSAYQDDYYENKRPGVRKENAKPASQQRWADARSPTGETEQSRSRSRSGTRQQPSGNAQSRAGTSVASKQPPSSDATARGRAFEL